MSPAAPGPSRAPFSPRTVFILLVVGVGAFVALGVLGAYAPALRERTGGGANALSRSAIGYAGAVSLLQAQGVSVVISRGRPEPPAGAPGLLVLTPPFATTPQALRAALPPGRRALVVLPKWGALPDPAHPGWISQAAPRLPVPQPLQALVAASVTGRGTFNMTVTQRTGEARFRLRNVAPLFQPDDRLWTGPVSSPQSMRASLGEVQLADDAGRAVLLKLNRDLYVLSDPDLLDNRGMASLETARTGLTILDELRAGQGPVVWDVTLNGLGRARSLLGLALAPPFLGASLCALAAALLMGVHAAARFGPARPVARAYALGKAGLLDNTAMLIRLARREPRMGRRYAALVRRALARRVLNAGSADLAGGSDAQVDRLDAALDRLTPAGRPPFSELAREAGQAREATTLMRAARGLHQRRGEMLGERP